MPLALNVGKCTLLGNYRENNEDSIDVKVYPDMTLCIVADGMGGQAAGEIASKNAIEVVPRELRKNLASATNEDQLKAVVRKAVVQANDEIITMGSLDRDLKNMGTTIVLALWRKGRELYISNLGDSRAYHIRGGKIEQLTFDHSLAWALVENKTISASMLLVFFLFTLSLCFLIMAEDRRDVSVKNNTRLFSNSCSHFSFTRSGFTITLSLA